jgi:perosamine synthetase
MHVPVCEPLLDGNELKYVSDCIQSNWISSQGQYIERFEQLFAGYHRLPHGIACTSCTTALYMALLALEIGEGDEVIIPDFTLVVSANVVIQANARPVLVDVDPHTWCIDPAKIEQKITPRTRAIMAVHMYGHPCDMPAILEIARRHNLFVIEDCAESVGAEIDGQLTGTFSHISCFSFYGNKIITTGEGGMCLTRDEHLAARLRLLRDQGFQDPRFVHQVVGFNFRMTNMQAAIGLAQTERIVEKVEKKVWIGQTYNKLLANQAALTLPADGGRVKNVYWMYGVLLEDSFGATKDQVMKTLAQQGIGTRSFFCPMHLQPVFLNAANPRYPDCGNPWQYPVSSRLWERGLYLPSGLGLTIEQMRDVASQLIACQAGKGGLNE